MGAGRTVSTGQSSSLQTLDALIISLCTRLEQRMVKQSVFCRQAIFSVGYKNRGGWRALFHFANPLQDAIEFKRYIMQRIKEYETASPASSVLTKDVFSINITVQDFIKENSFSIIYLITAFSRISSAKPCT